MPLWLEKKQEQNQYDKDKAQSSKAKSTMTPLKDSAQASPLWRWWHTSVDGIYQTLLLYKKSVPVFDQVIE